MGPDGRSVEVRIDSFVTGMLLFGLGFKFTDAAAQVRGRLYGRNLESGSLMLGELSRLRMYRPAKFYANVTA